MARLSCVLSLAVASVSLSCGSGGPTEPLVILVTNDDGFNAAGIDAIVEALRDDPRYDIKVSAPSSNRSGSSDQTTDPPPSTAMIVTTLSGFPAASVDGFPADSVIYALENLYEDPPHLVVSGSNEGQNVSQFLADISGTVGAAKTAARRGVPAVAVSQGTGNTFDYPASVEEVLLWIEEHRNGLLSDPPAPTSIDSINVPSCDQGEIRGRVRVPVAQDPQGQNALGDQNCNSTLENPEDDLTAFLNGFVSITEIEL